MTLKSLRRDVVLSCIRQGQWRMAVTVLVMPSGYVLEKQEAVSSKEQRIQRAAERALNFDEAS